MSDMPPPMAVDHGHDMAQDTTTGSRRRWVCRHCTRAAMWVGTRQIGTATHIDCDKEASDA